MSEPGRPPLIASMVATVFGVGHLKPAPGTWGSIVAVLLVAWELYYERTLVLATLVVIAGGVWAAGRYGRAVGRADAPEIVIDEVAGQWLSLWPMLWLPAPWHYGWTLLIGLGLFRLFDILKPWPIGPIDRRTRGGWGVMADDLAAGAIAALVLALLLSLFRPGDVF